MLRAPDHNIRLIIKLRFGSPAIAREPEATKKTELQIPAARGMFAPHLKVLVYSENLECLNISLAVQTFRGMFAPHLKVLD